MTKKTMKEIKEEVQYMPREEFLDEMFDIIDNNFLSDEQKEILYWCIDRLLEE